MTSTLRTLLDRVEKGEGADVALNWDVAYAFGMVPAHRIVETGFDYDWYRRAGEHALWKANDSEGRDVSLWQPANVMSSIDASRALVQAVIPGTLVASGSMEDGPFCSMVVPREDGTYIGGGVRAFAKSEPRAVLACLLRAKIAQEEGA